MRHDERLSWHHYPLHLTSREIIDPLLVISEFFGSDWLEGHLKVLKKWRKRVMKEGFYKGNNDNPGALLFTYELNVRLVEAAFLLSANARFQELFRITEGDAEKQIAAEQQQWDTYPVYLSTKHLIDPVQAFRKITKTYTLPQYRDHLNDYLYYGLSVRACAEFMEAMDLIKVYESLRLLYGACWLIHMRTTSPVLLNAHEPTHLSEI